MYYLASLLAFAALVAAQAPTIATPAAVVQCQPAQISYVAANSPVFISIIPGGQPSAAPLQDLGSKSSSPFTWVASIAAGTQITFQIRDSTGAVAYSAPVTIQSSSDSSCLGAGASSASSAAGSVSQTSAASSSSAVASASSVSSSAAASTSSVVELTSSAIASVSSVLSSATAPATTSRATSSAASSSRTATATSAAVSPSTTPNSARSNMQVGFAGLVGLAAAAVLA